MFKQLIFFLVLIGFSIVVQSQTSLKNEYDIIVKQDWNLKKKIKEIKKIINKQSYKLNTKEKAAIYHELGKLIYKSNRKNKKSLNESIVYTKKAIRIKKELPNVDLRLLNKSLFNVSLIYGKLNNEVKRVKYLNSILKNNHIDKYYLGALKRMAFITEKKGDYFKALEYLDLLINSYSRKFKLKLLIDAHLTYIYILSKNISKIDFKKIDEHKVILEKLLGSSNNKIADIYLNLGATHYDLNNKKEALVYFKKALEIYLITKDSTNLSKIYTNIAIDYSEKKQYVKATKTYEKALSLSNNLRATADIYHNQAYHLVTNKPKDKIKLFQKAIHTVLEIKNDKTLISLPTLTQIIATSYEEDVLQYLTEKSKVWIDLYEKENKRDYLIYAKETLYLIDHLISVIRLESSTDKSKLFWIEQGVNTYMLAVKVCYLLSEPDEAFYFMEKNKSLLLLENLNKLQLKYALNIPEKTLQKEKDYKLKLIALNHKLKDSKNKRTLQNELVKTNSDYLIFKDSLKNKFPSYYNSKQELQLFTLVESIEKQVSKNENLIEYMLSDQDAYGLFCSESETVFFKIENPLQLIQDLKLLKNIYTKPFRTENDFDKFKALSFSVFKQLFPFKDASNKLKNKKLTIVSDYELQNFPFSTLIVHYDKSDKFTSNYLIKDTEISYLHSASVFQKLSKSTIKSVNKIIGFAPTIFKNDSLPTLKASELEMNKYISNLPFTLKLKDQATKKSFISSIKKYGIIHINTHAGYTENSLPWLSFYDETIDLNELYELENNSNLVILDACKTAQGEMQLGEGIASLSRGFFYGGSKSVLASQWNVNEQSNNKILSFFYNELKEGKSKSKALQNAKINYLETQQLDRLSPYFWASMTLTGNAKKMELYSDNFWLKIGFVMLLLIGITLLFFRFKKK